MLGTELWNSTNSLVFSDAPVSGKLECFVSSNINKNLSFRSLAEKVF